MFYNMIMSNDLQFESFELNRSGVGTLILKNNGQLQQLENQVMDNVLSEVRARFINEFGFEGRFKLAGFTTDRSTYKIAAEDAKTAAILKRNPGWLDQFMHQISGF